MIYELDFNALEEIQSEPENSEILIFTNYVREDTLRRRNGRIYGNWGRSFSEVCSSGHRNRYIHESSIINKFRVGECSNNSVWAVEHH